MTGIDFTQEEIDGYTAAILKAKAENQPIPKSFNINNTRCKKFASKAYDVDPSTKRLYQGTVTDKNSTDLGKLRLTLAKSNLADQNLAQEYLLRQFVVQPEVLSKLQSCDHKTKRGKGAFMKIFNELLHNRFDIAPAKFIDKGGAKGEWDLGCFILYARAYVDLFEDHPSVASDSQLPTDSAVIFQLQRHKELLNIIVCHCDDVFDKTSDDLEAMKGQLKALKKDHDSYNDKLSKIHERIDECGIDKDWVEAKFKAVDERHNELKEELDLLRTKVEQGMHLGLQPTEGMTNKMTSDWKKSMSEADIHRLSSCFTAKPDSIVTGEITGKEFHTLLPETWLSDGIIRRFLHLLQLRDTELQLRDEKGGCYFFSPFFITKLLNHGHETTPDVYEYNNVKKWTKRSGIDIFNCKKVFVPINVSLSHWLLAMIDFEAKKIQLYDSYRKRIRPRPELLNGLWRYLQDEHQDKKGCPLPQGDQWDLIDVQLNETPFQTNEYDCGVFLCMNACFLSLGQSLNFTQEDITSYGRNFIGLSILRHKVD